MGELFIVATPIGNLEDITIRAIRILKEVDFIFAEDTRTTGVILEKYEISNLNSSGKYKLISYNSHNQDVKNSEIIKLLEEGKKLALVSDAGTPGVSDPGYSVVREIRKKFYGLDVESDVEKVIEIESGLVDGKKGKKLKGNNSWFDREEKTEEMGAGEARPQVTPIPGPSALTTFISVLGVGSHAFTFYGFLPHKNGRQKLIKEMIDNKYSSIFYESTHRLIKFLEEYKKLGGTRKIAIGKELTKIYEEILIGEVDEILSKFETDPKKAKGEFVIMIV